MKIFSWFVLNGILFGSCYLGFFVGLEEAKNIALFMMWFSSCLGSVLIIESIRASAVDKSKGESEGVPPLMSKTTGVLILFIAASQGMYILCVFCVLRIIGQVEYIKDLEKARAMA